MVLEAEAASVVGEAQKASEENLAANAVKYACVPLLLILTGHGSLYRSHPPAATPAIPHSYKASPLRPTAPFESPLPGAFRGLSSQARLYAPACKLVVSLRRQRM